MQDVDVRLPWSVREQILAVVRLEKIQYTNSTRLLNMDLILCMCELSCEVFKRAVCIILHRNCSKYINHCNK